MHRRTRLLSVSMVLLVGLFACSKPMDQDLSTVSSFTADPLSSVADNSPSPTPSPSFTITTAPTATIFSPVGYAAGDNLFATLRPQEVSSVQIIISRDSQPPEYPDPVKTITAAADIGRVVEVLQTVEILRELKEHDSYYIDTFPVGASGYNVCLYFADGSVRSFYLYGDVYLSIDQKPLAIRKLPAGMDALYDALGVKEVLPSTVKDRRYSNPFEIGDRQYFAGDLEGANRGRVGQLIGHNSEEEDYILDLLALDPVQAWTDGKRVVYVGYESADKLQPNQKVLLSCLPDGKDRRVLSAGSAFHDPMWDSDTLWYVGGAANDAYPQPLYRASADFGTVEKVLDIPGLLVTVRQGDAFGLSAERMDLLRLPDGEKTCNLPKPVQSFTYVDSFRFFEFLCADGKRYAWKP